MANPFLSTSNPPAEFQHRVDAGIDSLRAQELHLRKMALAKPCQLSGADLESYIERFGNPAENQKREDERHLQYKAEQDEKRRAKSIITALGEN